MPLLLPAGAPRVATHEDLSGGFTWKRGATGGAPDVCPRRHITQPAPSATASAATIAQAATSRRPSGPAIDR